MKAIQRFLFLALFVFGVMAPCWAGAVDGGPEVLSESRAKTRDLLLKSKDQSRIMTERALVEMKAGRVPEAINSLVNAIETYPANTLAYAALAKIYLVAGQEEKIYEVLERAGRSYPSFDKILDVFDDQSLGQLPLEAPKESIFIAPFRGNKGMAVSFMFDDGESGVYNKGLPIFEKYGFRATIPIVAGQVGGPYAGSWHDWQDASRRGFEIANHSMGHRDLSVPAEEELLTTEIRAAKVLIEKAVGQEVSSFVFPFDRSSAKALQYAATTHRAIREPFFLRSIYAHSVVIIYGGPKFSVKVANRLIDVGVKRHVWVVAECHGVEALGEKNYKPVTVDFLNDHLSYIRSRSDDVWVDTFGNVFDYLSQRRKVTVEKKRLDALGAEFVLRGQDGGARALRIPMTVVLAVKDDVELRSATEGGDKPLKVWMCGAGQVCVDVDEIGRNIRLEWEIKGQL